MNFPPKRNEEIRGVKICRQADAKWQEEFVERFDPNSYLYITRAVDHFDLENEFGGNLSAAFSEFSKNSEAKFCVISFSDDWLFPPSEAKKLTQALAASGVNVSSVTINSSAGHDSFLLDNTELKNVIKGFIAN